jgi:methylthioxylose transferase
LTPACVAVGAWALLLFSSLIVGMGLLSRPEPDMDLDAPPLFGRFHIDLSARFLLPVAVAAVLIGTVHIWRELPWRRLLAVTFVGAFVWALALAATHGPSAVSAPLEHPTDYLAAVSGGAPVVALDEYVARADELPLHARSHPPGAVWLLSLLARVGLGGAAPAALLAVAAGSSAGPAALVALRTVAGEARARTAAPFLALAPAAVWIATSMDALFTGLSAWGIAALVVAADRRAHSRDITAVFGGLLFGLSLFFSYGVLPLFLIPLVVALVRGRSRVLLWSGAGTTFVVVAFAIAGFWWPDGLAGALAHYGEGISRFRPDNYFLIANLAALGVAVGPATVAGLAATRDRRVWLLVGATIAALLVADLSGFSKGEVERIWLPFMPWLLIVAGTSDKTIVPWCCVQAGWAILIQAGVQTPW